MIYSLNLRNQMELMSSILIGIALAMDSFSVSIAGGSNLKKVKFTQALLVGVYFGFFQFFMTYLGWQGGVLFSDLINSFDHWIAFFLLVGIGGKMIWESFNNDKEQEFSLNHKILFILAIATSIDALGVGLSYALLDKSILKVSIIIGIIAFIFSYAGIYLGKYLKHILKNKAELAGGIILIGIGFKIAIDHGAFF